MKLLVATHNPGKLVEYQALLSGLSFDLVTLDEVGVHDDIAESGATFAENARMKAVAYARVSGLLTVADDSGLEVDALGGEPGVRSKRYAGERATDAERIEFLLDKLERVPEDKRGARFRCVIAIATPEGRLWETNGTCEGTIAFEPRGTQGFGYDPIFQVAERGMRMAELPLTDKNQISHRARAAIQARVILEEIGRLT